MADGTVPCVGSAAMAPATLADSEASRVQAAIRCPVREIIDLIGECVLCCDAGHDTRARCDLRRTRKLQRVSVCAQSRAGGAQQQARIHFVEAEQGAKHGAE